MSTDDPEEVPTGEALAAEVAETYRRIMADPVARAKLEALRASVLARMTPRALEPGEEVRYFSSSADAWENLAGRAGYEIVKDGKVVERVITMMN